MGKRFFLGMILFLCASLPCQAGSCHGRFVNPVTDICWKCVFPMTIMGIKIVGGNPSPEESKDPICFCKRPHIPVPLPGLPVSFWEPARLADVTRVPYCLVNMGGKTIGKSGIRGHGGTFDNQSETSSFYQVHWYVYPLLYWLEVLMDFACLENASLDLAYLSELDPFWNDSEKSTILNPEALLFGNVIAQTACAADCAAASVGLPTDALFWCGGCQGSLYPFTGHIHAHNGGVQASLLALSRMMAKLHRELLLWGYMGKSGWCGKYMMPIIKKSQYRTQMTYPVPQSTDCQTLGKSAVLWQQGREYPYEGEDFGYLVWRKRSCCLL